MEGSVSYEVINEVAWLTIKREGARNALNEAVRSGLFSGFARFEADRDARVLILTGAGDTAFSAGADLKEMAELGLKVPPPDYLPQLGRNITVSKPVIAAVNGVALGGGFLLAQNCDLCIAATQATFGITEARYGRGFPWAAPLSWLIAPRAAMELMMTAQPVSAERAYEIGLVNKIVPFEELANEAQALAEVVASNAPLSVRAAKETVGLFNQYDPETAFSRAEEIWRPVYESNDAQEGPRAFREKRPPHWTGT